MDKEWVREHLPDFPSANLVKWAERNAREDLGAHFMTYRQEYVPVYRVQEMVGDSEDFKPIGRQRAAHCICSACTNHYYTKMAGTALEFWVDDCGQTYPIDPTVIDPTVADDDYDSTFGYTVEVAEGETFTCPCGADVTLIKASRLKGGRTKQVMVATVETVGNYAAVIYWMVYRTFYEYGDRTGVYPRHAYVLSENGGLVRYSHVKCGGYTTESNAYCWRLTTSAADGIDQSYHDWGSINNKKKGGYLYPHVPDLTGTTGEKTGLSAFCETRCEYAVSYLKLWRKYRGLENLVNLGWTDLVGELACLYVGGTLEDQFAECLDLKARKPHEMLMMTKAEFRAIRNAEKQWDYPTQRLYAQCRKSGVMNALQFWECAQSYSGEGIRALIAMQNAYGDADPERVTRYLQKQNMSCREVRTLLDARDMVQRLAGDRPLTAEELWPRDLLAVHDRLDRMIHAQADETEAAQYQEGFDRIREKYGDLEWSDGELCVILPQCNGDLIREGGILRHCVGCYGEDHINESHVIFFIRHARRPERCYYTLDISMQGEPYRNQLHGYGNERHGLHKQYIHHIPKKVTDFVTRWEQQVLRPWYHSQADTDRRKSA